MAQLDQAPDTIPHQSGPERDLTGVKHVPSSVRTAGETNVNLLDGFTQKKGTGPRKATKEYGGPKLRTAHQPNAGGSPGLDKLTSNPSTGSHSGGSSGGY